MYSCEGYLTADGGIYVSSAHSNKKIISIKSTVVLLKKLQVNASNIFLSRVTLFTTKLFGVWKACQSLATPMNPIEAGLLHSWHLLLTFSYLLAVTVMGIVHT